MKINTTVLSLIFSISLVAQNNPINFETGGFGTDWTWTVFENDTNPPLEIIANPDPTGVNTSSTVAKFTALTGGQPFAGVESMHGSDIGTFTLTKENAIVKIKVWKSVISDVGIKFVTPTSASTGEFKVANTLINQWEELTFDFTPKIGEPTSTDIDQIVIFPDFRPRSEDEVIYFDDIRFGDFLSVQENSVSRVKMFPNPASDIINIKSEDSIDQIIIYNILGQKVLETINDNNFKSLDISKLHSGTYFITILMDNEIRTFKLIKQ